MSEKAVQTKIIKYLKGKSYYVFKTILCSTNGVPDVIACGPEGKFVAVEVKFGKNKPSKLQEYNLEQIRKNKGIAIVAYSLEDVSTIL